MKAIPLLLGSRTLHWMYTTYKASAEPPEEEIQFTIDSPCIRHAFQNSAVRVMARCGIMPG